MSGRAVAPADPYHQPLLTAAGIADLLARGRRLARAMDTAPADAGRHGGGASRHTGSGLDFAEHRRYLPGDDVRRMDWRVTARLGQPHVRRYHEDQVPDCVLLVDRRATMRFATRGRLKVTQAVRLALLLAALHDARQAPLSVLSLDTALHHHGPLGHGQLPGLGQQLAAPCPPISVAGPALGAALARLARDSAPGSRLFLLSDFSDADDVPTALWHRLGRRHRVSALALSDPAEHHLPSAGLTSLCWPATGGEHRRVLDTALRERLQQDARQQQQALQQTLQQAGIRRQAVSTIDEDLTVALRRAVQ